MTGDLVKVAYAGDETEAELLQGLLCLSDVDSVRTFCARSTGVSRIRRRGPWPTGRGCVPGCSSPLHSS